MSQPITLFKKWYSEAEASGEKLPDAMTLATCTRKGMPSARIVLFKGISKGGFEIYTNLQSRKGTELIGNPRAALVFHWKKLDRQVRIEGRIERMTQKESERYFHTRPRQSQIGAWASMQSQPLSRREVLVGRVEHYALAFEDRTIPLPPHWGGFRLIPDRVEFWADGEFRLHHRALFSKNKKSGRWSKQLLFP